VRRTDIHVPCIACLRPLRVGQGFKRLEITVSSLMSETPNVQQAAALTHALGKP